MGTARFCCQSAAAHQESRGNRGLLPVKSQARAHPPAPAWPPCLRLGARSVKAMEVDEKPTEDYSDIGGLDKQARPAAVPPRVAASLLACLWRCCCHVLHARASCARGHSPCRA